MTYYINTSVRTLLSKTITDLSLRYIKRKHTGDGENRTAVSIYEQRV